MCENWKFSSSENKVDPKLLKTFSVRSVIKVKDNEKPFRTVVSSKRLNIICQEIKYVEKASHEKTSFAQNYGCVEWIFYSACTNKETQKAVFPLTLLRFGCQCVSARALYIYALNLTVQFLFYFVIFMAAVLKCNRMWLFAQKKTHIHSGRVDGITDLFHTHSYTYILLSSGFSPHFEIRCRTRILFSVFIWLFVFVTIEK